MTDLSYYPPPASPRPGDRPGTPGPVLVAFGAPATQHRATVAFRVVLAVPHVLALYFLGIAASAVAVAGWLGALATGRLPGFAARYLSGYLRWYCRAGAYLLLLTDEYPPFTLADAAYPVRAAAGPGRLNRLTVLLRGILAIPAGIVSLLLALGAGTIVSVIAWLTALITGRLPGPLHQAFAAVLRYAARCHGYQCLLTDAYPAGLFGDRPGTQAGPAAGGPLVLSPGARRLVGLILTVGLLTVAGGGAWAGAAIHAARVRAYEIRQLDADVVRHNGAVARHNGAVTREQAAVTRASNDLNQVTAANDTLNSQLNTAVSNINACGTLSCMDAAALPAAKAFAAFGRTLRSTPVPPGAAAAARRLAADSADNERDWTSIANSASFTDYENTATSTEPNGTRFDNDYPVLTGAMSQAIATLNDQAATLNAQAAALNRAAAVLSRRAVTLNAPITTAHVDLADNGL